MGKQGKDKRARELREMVEKKLDFSKGLLGTMSEEDTHKLVHELQVYQMELEVQNEELHRAQLEIEESRKKYYNLYDLAPVGYLTLDGKGKILEANLTAAKMMGVERARLIRGSFYDYIKTEDKDIFYLHLKGAFEGKGHQSCELRLVGEKDGGFYAQVDSIPIEDSTGGLSCMSSITDITGRKRAEEGLKESEKKYRGLVADSLVGIYKSSLKGDILYANEALSKMFEFDSPGELMSCRAMGFYKNPKDREVFIGTLKKRGKLTGFELEAKTKTGKIINVLLSATLEGETIAGMVIDVTGHKEAERERENLQAQLFRAQNLESLGILAGGVAHNFNNLLTSVKGYAELTILEILKIGKPEPWFKYLKRIIFAVDRATELVTKLLLFARRKPMALKPLNINRTVDDMQKMLRPLIGENIAINTDLEPRSVPTKGASSR
jgi:PAS domain S-box-containing protein